jgi:hypothetical protein
VNTTILLLTAFPSKKTQYTFFHNHFFPSLYYKLLVLWALCFHEPAFSQSEQAIAIIGDARNLADSCKCQHLLNRHRGLVPLNLTRQRWQNIIRDNFKNNSELERKMTENYFWKCGDYQLAETEFRQIANYAQSEWFRVKDSFFFTNNGETYTVKRINFYPDTQYDFVFGYALVVADKKGAIVGFKDYYNFDKKPFAGKGKRKLLAELVTRFMRVYARKTKSFFIYYGVIPPTTTLAAGK